ncbi:MAG: hypothetical protein ACLFWM_08995 [Actinomycetota bacterium]
MDLSRYWSVVRDQWIFFVVGILLTASLATLVAVRQPDVYEATGTFVVRPRMVEREEVVRAIDTLNRSVEIGATYAFIARSDLIEDRAEETLGENYSGLSVQAELVPGTNVIEISVRGGDPDAVGSLARAVGDETVAYVADLEDAFELVQLDAADDPNNPVGPQRPLTIGLGVFFGVGVGSLMALLAQLAREWQERPVGANRTDSYTGVYSEEYFNARFRQEVIRAKRRGQAFSLGLMRFVVDHRTHEPVPSQTVLRQVGLVLQGKLGDDDILAYLGDGVFGIMLMGYDAGRAEWQLKQWQKDMESHEFTDSGFAVTLRVAVGVGSYGDDAGGSRAAQELISELV